jgi:hypothetical protein
MRNAGRMSGSDQPSPPSANCRIGGFCQSIDWYAEGESRIVEVGEVQVCVRLIGRRGRRARIAITAPAGAAFRDLGASSPK